MDQLSPSLFLKAALWTYAVGAAGSLLFMRRDWLATLVGFGGAILAGSFGLAAALLFLVSAPPQPASSFDLWTSLIPYLRLTVKLDPLGAFFLALLSLMAVALSIYSLGYVKIFYG